MSDKVNRDAENAASSKDDLGNVTEGTAAPKTNAAAAGAVPAGKGGTNPLHNAAAEEGAEPSTELPEHDLESGGEG
jgi:hypothetical protein